MEEKDRLLIEAIKEAELVLVGIGEEFAGNKEENENAYNSLKKLLRNKNYFMVTTNMDDEINRYGFQEKKIVEPCGNLFKLQCKNACHTEIYLADAALKKQIEIGRRKGNSLETIQMPICPKCGQTLCFNICTEERYIENGYLTEWEIYTKWLQGSLNKRICIIELGVGMKYPTVIRWPFEKAAFFNQKATFFRIHSVLYQMPEELNERGYAIKESPLIFLNKFMQ